MKTIKNKIISSLFLFIFLVSCSSSELNETKIIKTNEEITLENTQIEKLVINPIEDNSSTKETSQEKTEPLEKVITNTNDNLSQEKEKSIEAKEKDPIEEGQIEIENIESKKSEETIENKTIIETEKKVEETVEKEIIDNSFFQETVDTIFSKGGLNSSQYGIKVVNLSTDKTIYEKNGDTSFVPASNAKLYTAGAAIKVLGEDYKFKTRLAYRGTISSDGTLDGDLYIIGGGDPTLGSKYMYNKQFNMEGIATSSRIQTQLSFLNSWTNEVKKLGITNINGKILIDNSHFDKINPAISTWEWSDMSTSFGAPPSGVNILDNIALINFKRGQNTTITPSSSMIEVENETIDSNINKVVVSVPAYSKNIVALGEVNTSISKEVPLPNPELLLADLFRGNLEKSGISSSGGVEVVHSSSNSKVFYTHYSPTVGRIVTLMNSYSINLFAEVLKLEIEKVLAKNRPISISRYWYEILKSQGFRLYDGSGLSRYNRVTPSNLTDLLSYMYSSNDSKIYYNSLAIAGNRGTLQNFNKYPLKNNLHAKSGTLTGVKSYSGYITNANDDVLAFSILVNLHGMSNYQITAELKRIMAEMYKLQ